MNMRDIISLCETLGDFDAGKGGGWIDEHGRFLAIDRAAGDTHARVAADTFFQGDIDELDPDAAEMELYDLNDIALEAGWVRITQDGLREFGAEWTKAGSMALRGVLNLIESETEYSHYYLNDNYFLEKRKAMQAIRKAMQGN